MRWEANGHGTQSHRRSTLEIWGSTATMDGWLVFFDLVVPCLGKCGRGGAVQCSEGQNGRCTLLLRPGPFLSWVLQFLYLFPRISLALSRGIWNLHSDATVILNLNLDVKATTCSQHHYGGQL